MCSLLQAAVMCCILRDLETSGFHTGTYYIMAVTDLLLLLRIQERHCCSLVRRKRRRSYGNRSSSSSRSTCKPRARRTRFGCNSERQKRVQLQCSAGAVFTAVRRHVLGQYLLSSRTNWWLLQLPSSSSSSSSMMIQALLLILLLLQKNPLFTTHYCTNKKASKFFCCSKNQTRARKAQKEAPNSSKFGISSNSKTEIWIRKQKK